ncbi:MAG: mannose-1-phosphate guanylyltransferase/mannose-6-phosphate isomerase [Maricaulis sp.]|uniref:mannose-1-phosphate guanylyltransferase/mannose-6-phosphate isomerase n=1 Tax=Maricaulis sp. TaxID=1486257 RepID=UPI001B239617|nr:mannose-1-phosphate guanylyltransferase/mannose-6-phosphate isomerase [Maricaulis sp.]MBO6697074.1 mannose-1-phosphate guanylyltransferase/mannose-6-phosphate isomerase [Henriciella sp.]MBO6848083.1 mannose-1-phosphate guanylyltransferase/mannose-6-phosphate isomerase [Maricaulis sp.]MBO6877843.1 mannose-1-phosphate guanylyltransferase/mannose-6-phosphate isomerase [Maricaulis sp.]
MPIKVVPVIMSGGSGTRLWPLSRKAMPKQMHALISDLTLIQHTIERVAADGGELDYTPPIVILNESQLNTAEEQVTKLGLDAAKFVVEPEGRNTAPVAAVAAELVAKEHGEDALVLLMPADHHIEDEAGFRATVQRASHLGKDGRIVTFGIRPTEPATGFGYIQRGDVLGDGYQVTRFTEKPDIETAAGFIAQGDYYWNAGIFLFNCETLKAEMQRHEADMMASCHQAVARGETDGNVLRLDPSSFASCRSESFDYAIMEKTDLAAVVPADFAWSDVGSWSALWDVSAKDDGENVARGDVILEGAENCLVMSTGVKVGVIGCHDLVVVVTEDAVLVTEKSHDQKVKLIVEALKKEGRLDLL